MHLLSITFTFETEEGRCTFVQQMIDKGWLSFKDVGELAIYKGTGVTLRFNNTDRDDGVIPIFIEHARDVIADMTYPQQPPEDL